MDNKKLWDNAYSYYEAHEYDVALEIFKELSEKGNSKASYMIGHIYQKIGDIKCHSGEACLPDYLTAVRWYEKTIEQDGFYLAHYGMAKHYYFGLGGKYNFKLAAKHLKKFGYENELYTRLMMAELCYSGIAIPKNLGLAKEIFQSLYQNGYIVGLIGLRRLAILDKKYLKFIIYFFKINVMVLKILSRGDSKKLLGIGGKFGQFRLNNLDKNRVSMGGVTELFPKLNN